MLPEGWQRRPLSECAKFVSGGTPNKDTPEFWGGSFPWITAKDMKSLRLNGAGLTLTNAGKEEIRTVPAGSILVLTRGMTLLKDLPVCIANTDVTFNQDVKALLPTKGIDSDFLANQLIANKREILDLVDTAGHGTGRLDTDLLKDFAVAIAPLKEQIKIGKILMAWDSAIATAERLLANSRKQKQGLMTHFLRKQKKWKLERLDKISTRIQRESNGENHPILMISAATGFVPQSEMYSRFMAGKSLENYVLLRHGEFAYNKGNSKSYEFGCIYPLENFEDGLVPHVYVCFSMNESICFTSFYKYLFESDYLHDQLGALVNTGVRNNGLLNIRPADFLGTKVPVPPMKEQKQIAEALDLASNVIRSLEQNIEKLKAEKVALMQQLLTGKRRLKAVKA